MLVDVKVELDILTDFSVLYGVVVNLSLPSVDVGEIKLQSVIDEEGIVLFFLMLYQSSIMINCEQ